MSRYEIRLRQRADNKIERLVSSSGAWVETGLGLEMDLGGETLSSISRLFFAYLSAEDVDDHERSLRLAEQRKIGRSLYQSVFGAEELGSPGRWIHIIPTLGPDPHANERFIALVCRLPWCFLPRSADVNAIPLALDPIEPTVITVDAAPGCQPREWFDAVRFPSVPRALLIIPDASGYSDTDGPAHADALRMVLEPYYKARNATASLRIVKTFSEFDEAVRLGGFDPQLVYFYGHGLTSGQGTEFVFEAADGGSDLQSVDTLRNVFDSLVQRTSTPPLIWFNACLGAAADQDSAMVNLAPVSTCIITTRTIIAVADGRRLAEAALPLIITQGYAPHSALGRVMNDRPAMIRSARWANLIIAAQYRTWSALGPASRRTVDPEAVGDFPAQLDRVEPLAAVADQLVRHLGSPASGPEIVLWRGGTEQGLDVFEDRVGELLLDSFPQWQINTRRIELQADCAPTATADRDAQFRIALLTGLLRAPSRPGGEANIRRIRDVLRNIASGHRTILALEHGPFKDADLDLVRAYLEFWVTLSEWLPEPGRDFRIVLGFGFEDEGREPGFEGLPDVPTRHLRDVPATEMEGHLGDYREFYNVRPSQIPMVTQDLIARHQGRFVDLRRALEKMAGFS